MFYAWLVEECVGPWGTQVLVGRIFSFLQTLVERIESRSMEHPNQELFDWLVEGSFRPGPFKKLHEDFMLLDLLVFLSILILESLCCSSEGIVAPSLLVFPMWSSSSGTLKFT
jgi:hypothetical protein